MTKIYNNLKYLLLLSAAVFLWNSCNVINPPEQIPTYIHVDSFSFRETAGYPVTTHQITQVWAYYNNSPIGAFDLPATIPVMATGTGTLELDPGIVVDGLNNLTSTYPFYEIDTSTLVAQPGKTIVHEPHTQLYPGVVDSCIDGFKFANKYSSFFPLWTNGGNTDLASQANLFNTHVDSLTLDGISGGIITLVAGVTDSSIDSGAVAFGISYSGDPCYIELDYRCDVPFQLGLQVNLDGISSTPFYLAGIYPSATWQKFYLAVADFAGQYKGTSYNLYIRSVLPAGQAVGHVYLDNIQLVHF